MKITVIALYIISGAIALYIISGEIAAWWTVGGAAQCRKIADAIATSGDCR